MDFLKICDQVNCVLVFLILGFFIYSYCKTRVKKNLIGGADEEIAKAEKALETGETEKVGSGDLSPADIKMAALLTKVNKIGAELHEEERKKKLEEEKKKQVEAEAEMEQARAKAVDETEPYIANKFLTQDDYRTNMVTRTKKQIARYGDCEKIHQNDMNSEKAISCLGDSGAVLSQTLKQDNERARVFKMLLKAYKDNNLDDKLITQALTDYFRKRTA